MKVETTCNLSSFRRFIILSTCQSFIPRELLEDENVFPERDAEHGAIYVEAEDKETVEKIGDMTFVRVFEVLGVIYNSKSGRTRLKWRSSRGEIGRLSGEASGNSLVNLYAAGVLDHSYARRILTGLGI
ncbi:MAG: hypothetical protein QXF26_07190 [Candidatus Bathyarchaeia archaeon]